MTGGQTAAKRSVRVEQARARLRERLASWPSDEVEKHLARGTPSYWLTFETDALVRHAEIARAAERGGQAIRVETRVDPKHGATEIVIYTADHPGLFAAIAGAMALSGASVVDAKIVTLANGMALDTFWIQDTDGGAFDSPDRLKRLVKRIEDTLSGKYNARRELETIRAKGMPARISAFQVPPRVLIDNKASASNTVIEINGQDRPGFLRDVTATLTALGLQISSAHISTYGARVVDVFYVRDVFGLKVEQENKVKAIRERLLQAIAPEGPKGAAGDKELAPRKGRRSRRLRAEAAGVGAVE
jgi:[protein-PII] uridylyltransferase